MRIPILLSRGKERKISNGMKRRRINKILQKKQQQLNPFSTQCIPFRLSSYQLHLKQSITSHSLCKTAYQSKHQSDVPLLPKHSSTTPPLLLPPPLSAHSCPPNCPTTSLPGTSSFADSLTYLCFIAPNFYIYIILFYKMDKFNAIAANHLLSFDKAQEIAKMTPAEKQAFNGQIKKQAAYFMLSVSRAVESKDYKTAKAILIYIADSCSCIQQPDFQVRYLIEVCCQHLAFIQQVEEKEREQNQQACSVEVKSEISQNPIYVFKYNKFKGEFQCDQNRDSLNQSVLFYMSKLNAILFNYQNTENQHSLVAMLKTYYPSFIMLLVLTFILFMVVFTGIVQRIMGQAAFSEIPVIIVCFLFLIPLVKIYVKQPMKKDSTFFEKKLGEEILKINKECLANGQNIKFFMPEGIEINVQVNYDEEPRPSSNGNEN